VQARITPIQMMQLDPIPDQGVALGGDRCHGRLFHNRPAAIPCVAQYGYPSSLGEFGL
jgi:hypothetical protein